MVGLRGDVGMGGKYIPSSLYRLGSLMIAFGVFIVSDSRSVDFILVRRGLLPNCVVVVFADRFGGVNGLGSLGGSALHLLRPVPLRLFSSPVGPSYFFPSLTSSRSMELSNFRLLLQLS